MTSTSTPEDTSFRPLSPVVLVDSQLIVPSSSASISPDSGSTTSLRSSDAVAQTSHSTLRLHSFSYSPTNIDFNNKPLSPASERSRSLSASTKFISSPFLPRKSQKEEPRQIILSSFAPRVAIYTSPDTQDLIKEKGFNEGLRGLLRPFGELIQGKVFIRDSVGSSRGWDDFGVRFMDGTTLQSWSKWINREEESDAEQESSQPSGFYEHDSTIAIDKIISYHLRSESTRSERISNSVNHKHLTSKWTATEEPVHIKHLRKLLSSMSTVPYETFTHPVACIIAISSRNSAPIETLRQLYASTARESNLLPLWISTECLRYYVLIHDEENDDITKSTALFDLMKRHFGLHCHLLRLRSSQCVPTDDDVVQVPHCEWLAAEEELVKIHMAGKLVTHTEAIVCKLIYEDRLEDLDDHDLYVHESDATAIRSFLREMVTQSIIPYMESRIMTWNDQVFSRRRGISGRFMSLSKRFAGLGSIKATQSGTSAQSALSGSNYNALEGYYPSETSEATMRQLADYAFMLRDWKHAYNTYDFLRVDFGNDKAWIYQAAASEMCAISYLMIPRNMSSKSRSETLDHLLDVASYSYLTRCSKPSGATRCLTLAIELLNDHGSDAAGDAANWGAKLLELGILTPVAQAFIAERIADCYKSQQGNGLLKVSSRKRRTAFWNTLASKTWLSCEMMFQARGRLQMASSFYQNGHHLQIEIPLLNMRPFWTNIEKTINIKDETCLPKLDNNDNFSRDKSNSFVNSNNNDIANIPNIKNI